MAEKEFWASSEIPDQTSVALAAMHQAAGISNKPFFLIPRQNVITQKTEFSLEENDCKRLLKEFPLLNQSYETRVPIRSNEKEFWDEFLKKNFEYKTEIFGGNNPIFIPFTTDAKNYEDIYIHNPKLLLSKVGN